MKIKMDQKPIGSVLFQYDLFPEKIETHGKVKKVYTSRGNFALKESTMKVAEQEWFVHIHERLERIGFHYVIPIISTKYGDKLVRFADQVYYLMPWYEDHTEFRYSVDQEEVIIEALAKLHGLTEKSQDYSEEVLQESYDALKKRWGFRKLEMERYAEQVEGNVYLSPFELTFLTHFQRSLHLADVAEKHLSTWFEKVKEKKSFRSVLCHGRPSRKHALFDKYGTAYFINFEKATLDTPVRDLALLFRHYFQAKPWDDLVGRHWLQLYERHFALFDEEKHLFVSYLAFPENIYQSVDAYNKKDSTKTEAQSVVMLERKILTMNRILRFIKSVFPEE